MYPADLTFKMTLPQAVPPPVQQEGNKLTINFSLNIPELIFLSFMENVIKSAVNQKNDLAYIAIPEGEQTKFSAWVDRTLTNFQFSPEELKLDAIVTSIWVKSKTFTLNQLILSNNHAVREHEEYWQMRAVAYSLIDNLQGHSGKVFTGRQLTLLVKTMGDTLGYMHKNYTGGKG